MDARLAIFLFVVSSRWSCNARDLSANHVNGRRPISTVLQLDDELTVVEAHPVGEVLKNEKLCTLCEEFATKALAYLSDNKTQTEIISILHNSCSRIGPYKEQCILLVDYYAPLFFLEASEIHAEDFCKKFDLCEGDIFMYQHLSKDKCDVCHDVVDQALEKLKDPDTEMEIIQLLLKACNSIGQTAKKCKRLVFEYAPVILVNAEQFLENQDVCKFLHVCDSTTTVGAEPETSSMHAAS